MKNWLNKIYQFLKKLPSALKWIIIIAIIIATAILFYNYKINKLEQDKIDLQNKLIEQTCVYKEKETIWSKQMMQLKDLNTLLGSKNKDLAKLIDKKNEEVIALNETVIKLKDTIIKIKNAKQTIVKPETIVISEDCEKLCQQIRTIVEFEKYQDPVTVKGNTITNPPEAEVLVRLDPFKLSIVITQLKDKSFKTYIDTGNPNIIIEKADVAFNPLAMKQKKWYQKFYVMTNVSANKDYLTFSGNVMHSTINNWLFGINITKVSDIDFMYGATVGYNLFGGN